MFAEAMKWRADRGVSALFSELHPLAAATARQLAARAHFYGGFGGFAKDGSPYFVERLGAADLAGFAADPNVLDLMFDAYVAHLETIFRSVRKHASAVGHFSRCLIVVDAAGVGFSTLRHIGIIKAVAKIGPPTFPEGSSKVIIVNAPLMISAAFALVSPLLPKRTRAKITIASSRSAMATLAEFIDDDQIPAFLGGTRCCDDFTSPLFSPLFSPLVNIACG
jgi:hypothetical protein